MLARYDLSRSFSKENNRPGKIISCKPVFTVKEK
jgi:hypothetical protein